MSEWFVIDRRKPDSRVAFASLCPARQCPISFDRQQQQRADSQASQQ